MRRQSQRQLVAREVKCHPALPSSDISGCYSLSEDLGEGGESMSDLEPNQS